MLKSLPIDFILRFSFMFHINRIIFNYNVSLIKVKLNIFK
jgi:hypothetical protein